MTYAFYAKRIALKHLKKFASELKKFERTKDAEALHEARVAARRLRNALWVFKKLLPKKERKKWAKHFRPLTRELGLLRDLDVRIAFVGHLTYQVKDHSLQIQLKRLSAVLKLKRENLLPQIRKTIKSFSKEHILRKIKQVLGQFPDEPGPQGREKLYAFSRKRILQRLMKFLDYQPYVHKPQRLKELHQMRINAKKLRYTMECLDAFYAGRLEKFIEQVQTFQDVLGRFHDLDLWFKTTSQEFTSQTAKEFKKAVVYFLEVCKDERSKAFEEFGKLWEQSMRSRTWDRLVREVSSTPKS